MSENKKNIVSRRGDTIPSDWEIKELSETVEFLDGRRKPIKDADRKSMQGIYPYFGASGVIDYVNSYIFDEELILLGEDGANIVNRSTPLAFKVSGKIWVNNHAHVLRPRPSMDVDYLTNYLESIKYDKYNTGTAQPKLNKEVCGSIPVLCPPLPEQHAIAACLSTWDKAIAKTEAIIAQKELQKKWLMQALLTGKKRLPAFANTNSGKNGFEGEWKKLGAGEIFRSVTAKGFSDEELLSATQDRGMIPRTKLEGRVTMPTTGTEGFKLVEIGDFVISLRSFQGGLEYSYYRGLVSPAYTVLKPKKVINEEFYKQYFKSYEFIGRLATAVIGIRDGKQISYEDFCFVRIPYPSIEEQTSIANMLQAADKEINLLKAKSEKLKEQKRGLMQMLLTGKVRLNKRN